MSTFGSRLKELRLENNMTQEQLGKLLKKSKNNISQYERDIRQADDETKKIIADYFNVSIDYLVGYSDNRNSPKDNNKTIDEELEEILKKLNSDGSALMFKGQPLSDKAKEALLSSLKHTLELAEKMNKKDN